MEHKAEYDGEEKQAVVWSCELANGPGDACADYFLAQLPPESRTQMLARFREHIQTRESGAASKKPPVYLPAQKHGGSLDMRREAVERR